jgi:uncharacterized protein
MKQTSLLIATVLFCVPFLFAQTANKDTLENSLLWEISGNGLKTSSYLYGTIHIIPEKDFFMTDATVKAFGESKQVAFEIDLDEMNNPFKMMGMMGGMIMKNGTTLQDLLSKEEYKRVSRYILDSMGMPPFMASMMEKVKPMFLSEMVGMDMSSMDQGSMGVSEGSTSYEMEFNEMAKEQGKETKGLETINYQLSIFDSIPYKDQALMLLDAIDNGGEEESEAIDEMTKLYVNQDLNGLDRMINGDADLSNYMQILLINRNKNWIPVMGKMAKAKSTFFAVGAGHLPGEQGVIRLLRAAGYTVTALK